MAVSISDVITYRRLVACGNDKLYYEDIDVAGTMTELDTSGYTIDTSDQLVMFEAYQKVFVVNGAKLGVADFVNTKLSTADVRPDDGTNVAPMHGITLTGETSNATMIVDYCNANNGAALIYGYVTSGTFQDAEVVTGTNPSGTPTAVSFTTDASPVSSPHWYQWTVYPTIGGVSYGSLPAKAYLGCLFNGRCVLAANPNSPHQWYMSRQANPWDWAYFANDAQSPVSGGDDDPGKIGDVVRALIPFDNDRLVFGCANSTMQLRGDPTFGGVLGTLDDNVGIFGSHSFCFDGDGNLYFWGTGGIYKCTKQEGVLTRPELLTAIVLPEIIADEGADPSTHRITMGYDRKRFGIMISVTKIADGSNSCYWYDLRTKGFFPESYPDVCGAYSMFYYAANDPAHTDLLIGSKDGYIRRHLDTAKDDDSGGDNTKISSYCTLPITKLGEKEDDEGRLNSLTIATSGGASGVTIRNTDSVSYELHVSDDAETCLENILDGAAARESGTLTGTGRQNRIRKRIRGRYLGIKLYNTEDTETWAIESVTGEIKPVGKL